MSARERAIEVVKAETLQHRQKPALARGVDSCLCGWTKVGAPGSWAEHFAEAVLAALESEMDLQDETHTSPEWVYQPDGSTSIVRERRSRLVTEWIREAL